MYFFHNFEPICCSMSSSNCCFLNCIQTSKEAGKEILYSHLLKNFPQFAVIHTVKGFGIVNKAEVDAFLELSCFFDDPLDVGNLISGSSAFSKSRLNIWKFMVHVLLKPGLENFEHYFAGVWDECNCAVVWTFFVIAFHWDWNENWPFPVLWPLLSFVISPFLPSYWGFSFALGLGVSFTGGIQHPPVDCCSAESCSFGFLAGEDECTSFYSAILCHI